MAQKKTEGAAKKPATPNKSNAQDRPLSAFEWMDKYRLPVIVVVFIALCLFGVVTFATQYFRDNGGQYDEDDVMATFSIDGEEVEVTHGDYTQYRRTYGMPGSDDPAQNQAVLISYILRDHMLEKSGVRVSDAELEEAIDRTIKERPDGKIDEKEYTKLVNGMRLTVDQFEKQFRHDLALQKMMRGVDRVANDITTQEIWEQYEKQFRKIKVKGVFWDKSSFEDSTKLARKPAEPNPENPDEEKPGELTQAAFDQLKMYWSGLDDTAKQRYSTGPVLSSEAIGFRFLDKTDEEIAQQFERVDPVSKTSLEKLTADYAPTDDDTAKMKIRLERARNVYGLKPADDVEKVFEARKDRMVQEWKIWKLVKDLHVKIMDDVKEKKDVDLKAIATANNLTHFKWTNTKLQDMVTHEEYPGLYAHQLRIKENGEVLDWQTRIGPGQAPFGTGPVDELGKHVSIWQLIDKNLRPVPALLDVTERVTEDYEREKLDEKLDEAVKGFEGKMDTWLDTKVKEFADKVKADTEAEIAQEIKDRGLDAEQNKDEIEKLREVKNTTAESKIDEEKDKYRTEAFEQALADPGAGLVVEEGYFVPSKIAGERGPERDSEDTEAKSRSSLRREFRTLHDQAAADTYVDVGTVSEVVSSTYYPGLRGMAMLVDKKAPTVQEMYLNPQEMQVAASGLMQKQYERSRESVTSGPWSWDSLQSRFKLESKFLEERITERREELREIEAATQRHEALLKARQAASANAAANTNAITLPRPGATSRPVTVKPGETKKP